MLITVAVITIITFIKCLSLLGTVLSTYMGYLNTITLEDKYYVYSRFTNLETCKWRGKLPSRFLAWPNNIQINRRKTFNFVCMETYQNIRPKDRTKAGNFFTFQTRKPYIYEELTKQRSLGLGQLISKEVARFVDASFLAMNFLSGDKDVSLPPGARRVTAPQRFSSCFKGDKGRSKCPFAPAVSQVALIHNNQYAKIPYIRVAYSALLLKLNH